MERWIGILVVAALAVLFLLLSRWRRKRIQPELDAFAKAYCALAARVLGGAGPVGHARWESTENGGYRLLPAAEQPERIRTLLEAGVNNEMREQVRIMFTLREEVQAHLSTINLIGEKINGVLNRIYDLTNASLAFINRPETVISEAAQKDFEFFLNQQAYIRGTTLAAIVSDRCKDDITI